MLLSGYRRVAVTSRGRELTEAARIQSVVSTFLLRLGSGIFGIVFLFAGDCWGQTEVERGRGQGAGSEWVPAVQQEWESFGKEYFQSVATNRPHATLALRDSSIRTGAGLFDIWLLIDGALVKGWANAGDLRVLPGPHCIRVEMVSVPQRYQGTVGRFWPWVTAGSKDEVRFSGDSKAGFTAKYQHINMAMKMDDLINPKQLEFARNQPKSPDAAYAYCLDHIRERRSQ